MLCFPAYSAYEKNFVAFVFERRGSELIKIFFARLVHVLEQLRHVYMREAGEFLNRCSEYVAMVRDYYEFNIRRKSPYELYENFCITL